MPTPKPGPGLFLGIELATDQLRASLLDDSLELVGVESVDFDTELSEYQTQGGIFTTPGEAYTTPVEMWVKGLDTLFEKLARNYDLTRIRAIGGCAQHAIVYWTQSPHNPLSSLNPHQPLHAQLPSSTFSLPHTPIAQDTSAHTHSLAIEALLGGPDHMAARVGMCANPSMLAAQLLRIREGWKEAWGRTGRVQFASSFLGSLILGRWMAMGETEAVVTGMWNHNPSSSSSSSSSSASNGQQGGQQGGGWDEGVLDIVGGSRDEGRRVRGWLGEVDTSGCRSRAGNVSRYLVERYGFDPETLVSPFTSSDLSTYLSLLPSQHDAVLTFGPMDTLLTPAAGYLPSRLYTLLPHPIQDFTSGKSSTSANKVTGNVGGGQGGGRRYIAVLSSRNADVPRALVRDMYTKSWSAFDRLVAIVPPGGSIGLDDKLFSFWYLQGDQYPYNRVKGIFRFETGVKVNEFRDLRANPRCLIESQVLSFRVKWSRMISTGVLGTRKTNSTIGSTTSSSATPPPLLSSTPTPPSSNAGKGSLVGMQFDPYDPSPLPQRIIATGAAANFPSVANLVGDVFNAPVFVPYTQVDSAQVVPHRNAPAKGFPGRAAIGCAYIARWVYGREWGSGGLGAFEDEMRRLLGKRWVASGGVLVRSNINPPTSQGKSGSGASTPFASNRRGLGGVEEEEEEVIRIMGGLGDVDALLGQRGPGVGLSPGVIGGGMYGAGGVGAFSDSSSNPNNMVNVGGVNYNLVPPPPAIQPDQQQQQGGAQGVPAPTPLTPVVALPSADSEMQIGLAKVAEPDVDAFMSYASVMPEFCRLEGLLIKGII